MAKSSTEPNEVSLCVFIILLLTHCYSVFAILDRRVYIDEDVRKNYKVEDFLWSGSGDGENEIETIPVTDEQTSWEHTTTVFHTTTIIRTSTVFYSVVSPDSPSTVECSQGNGTCSLSPTPTIPFSPNTVISPWPSPEERTTSIHYIPDQRYWLITILGVNRTKTDLVLFELEEHLANLYKTAFHRHQEFHLGLQSTSDYTLNRSTIRSTYLSRKRRDYRDIVTVHIHNVSNNDALSILYSVKVSGVPVLATTAAHDMKLVSDAEVVAELGYPVLTKAEPYLKPIQHHTGEKISDEKEYLFVLVSSVCAAVLIVLVIFIFLLTVKKRKRSRNMEKDNKIGKGYLSRSLDSHHRKNEGVENAAFTSENGENQTVDVREHSVIESKNMKTNSLRMDGNGARDLQSHSRFHLGRPSSPNSFLSMPSVKDFPNTPLPEPLTNLLNNNSPQSSHDKMEDTCVKLSRHSSIGGEDPGVIGPMVWHVHRHQLKKADNAIGSTVDIDDSSADSEVDVVHMRKRFNYLLDDALSAYSDRRSSNDCINVNIGTNIGTRIDEDDADVSSIHIDAQKRNFRRRAQSAAHASRTTLEISIDSSEITPQLPLRPRTSTVADPRKQHSTPRIVPEVRGAWGSIAGTPSTPARLHSRPLSAGPFHRPVIHPEFILTDAQLSPSDPAVPIISAIKRELDKIPEYKNESRDIINSDSRMRPSSSSSTSFIDDVSRH